MLHNSGIVAITSSAFTRQALAMPLWSRKLQIGIGKWPISCKVAEMGRQPVARLTAIGVRYYSEGDERAFFKWLQRIPCVCEFNGVGRDLRMTLRTSPTDDELRELIALFHRYKIDMRQLAAFETRENAAWFRKSGAYWHRRVFG